MRKLLIPLSISAVDRLALQTLQQEIDNESGYPAQVTKANGKWSSKPKALFKRVRKALEVTCSGARRCGYCEDSAADEIEHIRPKNWFPGQTFAPNNYLFSCGPCNSPKSNKYAVVDSLGQLIKAVRKKGSPVLPPPAGQEALLNPWYDDPADFLYLDILNTFAFKAKLGLNPQDEARAKYTIRVLDLNKDFLLAARRQAFNDFAGHIAKYHIEEDGGASLAALNQLKKEIFEKQQITVWKEMQNQATQHTYLSQLFRLVPGADKW